MCSINSEISLLKNIKWKLKFVYVGEIIILVFMKRISGKWMWNKNILHYNTIRHYSKNDGAPHHLEHLDGFNPIPKKYDYIY